MRAEKADKFRELKNNRTSSEYEMWFLNYSPFKVDDKIINSKEELLKSQESQKTRTSITKKNKKVKKKNKTRTTRTSDKKVKDILNNIFKK